VARLDDVGFGVGVSVVAVGRKVVVAGLGATVVELMADVGPGVDEDGGLDFEVDEVDDDEEVRDGDDNEDDDEDDDEVDEDVTAFGLVGGGPPHGPPVAGSRYQLFGWSPRQSPTVTNSYPRFLASSMTNGRSSYTDF